MRYDASNPEHNDRVKKILLDGLTLDLLHVVWVDDERGEVGVLRRKRNRWVHATLTGKVSVVLK